MAWYKTGTVNLTNGSANVVGVGTAFIANVDVGEGVLLADGRLYEVQAVTSDTSLTLGTPYMGSNTSGANYVVAPISGYVRDLAHQAATLVQNYSQAYANRITGVAGYTGNVTIAQLLTALKTVDGAGSGLDADLLDGKQASEFAPINSPALTGTPTAPTPSAGTNTTQLATTAFVLGNTENTLTSTSTTKALSAAMGNVLYNKTFNIPVKPKIVWDTVNSVYQRPNPTTGVMETLSNPLDMMLTQTLGTQRTVFNHKGNPVVVPNTELFITHNPSTGECLGFPAILSVANLIYPSEPNDGTYAFGVNTDWAQSVITKKRVAYDKLTSTTPLSFSIAAATIAECSFGCFVYDDLTTSTGTVSVFKLEYIRSGQALGVIECIYDFATRAYTYTGDVSESNGIPVGFDLPYALGWFLTSRRYSASSFGVTFTAGDIIKVTINGTGLHYGGFMLRNSFSYNLAYIKTTAAAVTETETKRGISLTSGFVDTHNFTCYMEFSRGGIGDVNANPAYYNLQNATGSETKPYSANNVFSSVGRANGLPGGLLDAPNKINKVAISVGRNGVMWVAMDGVLLNFSNTASLGIVGNMDKFWFHRDSGAGSRSGNSLHRVFKAWEYQASPAELVAMTAK